MNLSEIASGMSEMAASVGNDVISNALASVSNKIETLGAPFSEPLTDTEMMVVKFYLNKSRKEADGTL